MTDRASVELDLSPSRPQQPVRTCAKLVTLRNGSDPVRRVERYGRARLPATAWLGLVLTAAALGGCGASGDRTAFARPQVVEPGVRELDGGVGVGFVLVVRRIEIGATGWAVEAEIVNATPVRWLVGRPHFGGTKFGIYAAPRADELRPARLEAQRRTTPPLLATRFEPPLPGALEPHAR